MHNPEALQETWAELDDKIRGWWDEELHRAWEVDVRQDDKGTLLYLPHPYITPGGVDSAFPELYGWDTFFINLGLMAHDRLDIVRNHHVDQLFMIERYGMVLNGNRTFYLTRSQAPLHAEGIWRYHQKRADRNLLCFAYPLLKREYEGYWNGEHHRSPTGLATNRDLGDPSLRPELAAEAEVTDFTACFEGDIRRCNPLLTNCALVQYTRALANVAAELGWMPESERWKDEAERRSQRIRDLCWDEEAGFFFEYQFERRERLPFWSLCGYWTMWTGIATEEQSQRMVEHLSRFEHDHGLSQTTEAYPSPHPEFTWVQFGYPAGWPPMQMVVIEALDRYGYQQEAKRIAAKFLNTVLEQYRATGQLWEKYNVVSGKPEMPVERYPVPPMHGWSSAVVAVLGRRVYEEAS